MYLYFLWMKREQEKYFTTNRKDRCLSFLIVVCPVQSPNHQRTFFYKKWRRKLFYLRLKHLKFSRLKAEADSSVTPSIFFSVLLSLKVKHHIVAC